MALNRFDISEGSEESFGKLMKRIGALRANPNTAQQPGDAVILAKLPSIADQNIWNEEIPFADFLEILAHWNIAVAHIPDGDYDLQSVRLAYGHKNILTIKVPNEAQVKQSEEFLATNSYPIRGFYFDIYQKNPEVADRKKFHNQRIGEYTMGNCV